MLYSLYSCVSLRLPLFCSFLLLACSFLLPTPSLAQQAIINLPSADITPKKQLFIMNESFIRTQTPEAGWKATHFLTYGLNDTTELAITQFNVGIPKTENLTVAFGAKSVFPIAKERLKESDLKWTVGTMLPVSMQGQGLGYYGYSHFSGRLPKLKTRLTAGINASSRQVFGRDIICFIGGVEQPINSELSLVLEYYSGTHDAAGLIPGIVYHNHKLDAVFVIGWRIPNNPESGRSGFILEVGKFLGSKPEKRYDPFNTHHSTHRNAHGNKHPEHQAHHIRQRPHLGLHHQQKAKITLPAIALETLDTEKPLSVITAPSLVEAEKNVLIPEEKMPYTHRYLGEMIKDPLQPVTLLDSNRVSEHQE